MSCSKEVEHFPATELAAWLISSFKSDDCSNEKALIRAAVFLGAHPNTVRGWADGLNVPSGKYLWKMKNLQGFSQFFGATE